MQMEHRLTEELQMSRYERRMFFESLCELREWYRHRGADDAEAVLSVPDAVEMASRLLDRIVVRAADESDAMESGGR
jgi:hypothetical protein